MDFGFWILDFGFWILDFGFWILDFGFWILDFGFWILDFGFWMFNRAVILWKKLMPWYLKGGIGQEHAAEYDKPPCQTDVEAAGAEVCMVGEGGVEVVKTPQGADDGGNHVKKTDAKRGEEHIEAEGCRPGTAEGAGCVRPNDEEDDEPHEVAEVEPEEGAC